MKAHAWPVLTALPLLAGCINDTASLQIAGPDHALTLQARQQWIWKQQVDLEVVMARQPDCLRRSRLDPVPLGEVAVDVLLPAEGEFAELILILRQGARFYAVGTKNCELQRFQTMPPNPGTRLGTFRLEAGKLKYVAVPVSPPPAAQAK